MTEDSPRTTFMRLATLFAPALVVWPIWLYTMLQNDVVTEVFTDYWPMTVAMIVGSFVAGSTPLGGGVVAYPIAQLVFYWPTPDSRDASILVQSVGMNAAAYLIILRKRHLLDWTFILTFIVWGSVGMLLGLSVASPASIAPTEWPPGIVPPGLANILFGTLVLCFAIMYGYTADVLPALTPTASKEVLSGVAVAPPSLPTILFLQMGMVVAAIAGGFLSANVGSGSDMSLYIFGTLVWNPLHPQAALSETSLTASSVVVMGALSLLCSVARALNGGFERKILLCWGADAFVVALGAPIGALVLTPAAASTLRRLFYVMAVAQFVNFTLMEDAFFDERIAPYVGYRVWLVLAPLLVCEVGILAIHYARLHAEVARLRAEARGHALM